MIPESLVIFDVDGTLTATNAVDDECYRRAVGEVLSCDIAPADWADAPHISDTGIAHWLWQRRLGRNPDEQEIESVRRLFLGYLNTECINAPSRFAQVAGAASAMQHLRANGWYLALATGAWSASMQLKLSAAGIDVTGLPFSSSDDEAPRARIVQTALSRAQLAAKTEFSRVVSVGDATWDVACAIELGIPFVGVGVGERASRLRNAGATVVLPDYSDLHSVVLALESATVPGSGTTERGREGDGV